MKTNEPSLTSALYNVTKFSGKLMFGFFILGMILTAVSISTADPNGTYYELNQNATRSNTFYVNKATTYQIGFTTDGSGQGKIILYRLTYIHLDSNGQNVTLNQQASSSDIVQTDEIFSSSGNGYYNEYTLEQGTYKIEIISLSHYTPIFVGYGHFDRNLIAVTAVMWIIFSIGASIFFTVLPFAVLILIINAIAGEDHKSERKSRSEYPDIQMNQQRYSPQPPHQNLYPQNRERKPFIFMNFDLNKLTRNDWIGISFGFFFFIMFIVVPGGPFFFFSLIVFAIVFYSVSEREKTKRRLINILSQYPSTDINYLATQLDKKSKDIIDVLQIMILDEGYPIQLDMNDKSVKVVGDLSQVDNYGYQKQPVSQPINYSDQPIVKSAPIKSTPETMTKPQVTETLKVENEDDEIIHCTACGEPLNKQVKYCYVCGQKV